MLEEVHVKMLKGSGKSIICVRLLYTRTTGVGSLLELLLT